MEKSRGYLRTKKNPQYRLAAEILLGQFLRKDPLSLYLLLNQPLSPHQIDGLPVYLEDLDKLAQGVVIQDIVGWQTFYGERLSVGEGVFVPRPESENLVDVADEFLTQVGSEEKRKPAEHVLELCAGSGAISIALAKKRPFVLVDAVDLSHEALDFAWQNIFSTKLEGRIRTIQSDLCADPRIVPQKYKVILVNPPYKPNAASDVERNAVLRRAPEISTFSGVDGLDLIRRIVREVPGYLQPGGVLFMEFDAATVNEVAQLFRESGQWQTVEVLNRTRGLSRMIAASPSANVDLAFLKGPPPSAFYHAAFEHSVGTKPKYEQRNLRAIVRHLSRATVALRDLWTNLEKLSPEARLGTQKEWIDQLIEKSMDLIAAEVRSPEEANRIDPVQVFRLHLLTASLLEKHNRHGKNHFSLFALRQCDHLSGPIPLFARFFILMDVMEDLRAEGNRRRQLMPKELAPYINYAAFDTLVAETDELIEVSRAFCLGRLNKYKERLSFTAKNNWQVLEEQFAKMLTGWGGWLDFFERTGKQNGQEAKPQS